MAKVFISPKFYGCDCRGTVSNEGETTRDDSSQVDVKLGNSRADKEHFFGKVSKGGEKV
jgi:hypothetical protein